MRIQLYTTSACLAVVLAACDQAGVEPLAQRTDVDRVSTRERIVNPTPVPSKPPSENRTVEAKQFAKHADEGESGPTIRGSIAGREIALGAHSARRGAAAIDSLTAIRPAAESLERERYAAFDDNPLKRAAEHPVSTFSIDVDTGSYSNMRRFLMAGQLPPEDAVRVEEMLNYFSYDYSPPADRAAPFAATTELATTPWNPHTHLLQVGIQGYDLGAESLPPANLVFLVDVSGSMQSPDKLELLKSGLKLLGSQLRAEDRIAIAVYAGASGVVLESTPGDQTAKIHGALDALSAGGSTNGAAGMRLAYSLAKQHWIDGGVNRVLLATDGDFNVGTVDFEDLKDLVERERRSGISLTTLGFGTGNYNDHLMEQLADAGNGNYAYIDTLKEANRVLVQQMAGTLATIAKDVKIQIEFNPDVVAEYRLIGYENRVLRREDFNNDKVDAGEIGVGHSVTALYEVALAGAPTIRIDPLRYGSRADAPNAARHDELAYLRIRYKAPGTRVSRLIERAIPAPDGTERLRGTTDRFRFAAAVAAFGQILRGGRYTGEFGYRDVLELARGARGHDADGFRGEFLQLVDLANSIDGRAGVSTMAGQSG